MTKIDIYSSTSSLHIDFDSIYSIGSITEDLSDCIKKKNNFTIYTDNQVVFIPFDALKNLIFKLRKE